MATVYLAEDLKHQRKVAVKVLRADLAASLGPGRFLREVTIAANLSHPHILPLHDSGEADGFLYYVMPYVEGTSLRQKLIREGELPITDAVRILRDVADAMAYAHQHGVVHRDIKPENVMLSGRHALVTDFGVAKAVSEATGRQTLTTAGVALGTPAYMAPEQAAADPHTDHRADIYAWGVLAYELLTGRPPFTGASPQAVLAAHVMIAPEPVSKYRASIPPALAALVMKCLEKLPADRWQSADALIPQLEAVLTPSGGVTPTQTQPVGSISRPFPWRLALTVVAAVAVAGLAWWTVLRPRPGQRHIERIAVLPIDNATHDTASDILAEGLTRELISALTTAGVRVIGYRSVAKYRGADIATADVARELNVGGVVTGAVLRSGNEVQLAVELMDPVSAENLWSETFTAPANAMPDLRNRVARGIAEAMGSSGGQPGRLLLPRAQSVRPEVYNGYLLGMNEIQRYTPAGFKRAVGYLEPALALDSTFAPAWAALALAYGTAAGYGFLPLAEALPKAKAAVERALAADDGLSLAYAARAYYRLIHDWDFAGTEQDYRHAIQLSPSSEAYQLYGWLLSYYLGRHEEGVRALGQAVAAEPKSVLMHGDLAWRLLEAGQKELARQELSTAMALDPSYAEAWQTLAELEALEGRWEEAIRAFDRYEALFGQPVTGYRAFIYAVAGRKRDAAALADSLVRVLPEASTMLPTVGLVLVLTGRSDEGLALLEQAAKHRVLWGFHSPEFQQLRGNPRYQRLLATIGVAK